MHEYLTTRELAAYLRIKERRVYELVRRRAIPCSRVTGKWLFPRALVDQWVGEHLEGDRPARRPSPPVVAGSQDPLLDWAVKESGCGLALRPGGSVAGIDQLAAGQACVAGLHLFDPGSGGFNVSVVRERGVAVDAVLLEWAWRRQGLVLPAGNPDAVAGLGDLARRGLSVARRQAESGSGLLLAHLLAEADVDADRIAFVDETARSEMDLGLAILEGRARAGLAVEGVARALKLEFIPLMWERFDLLMRRRDHFEAPVQTLMAFAREPVFAERARRLGGYDVSGLGRVHYNAP